MCWDKVCYEVVGCESKLPLFVFSVSVDCLTSIFCNYLC